MSSEHPISVRLYVVKCEKDETYRQKEVFQLRDIRHVDGINPRKVIFVLHIKIPFITKRVAGLNLLKSGFHGGEVFFCCYKNFLEVAKNPQKGLKSY